jgi:hypothetical protein
VRGPAAWARTQSPVALMVVRLLLVANVLVLAAAGALCLASVSRPAAIVGAGVIWAVAALLAALVPYTNPRRRDRARW